MKEIKCRECGAWVDSELKNCTNCGTSLRAEEVEREEKRYKLFEDQKPTKFELWLESLKKSNNPIKLLVYGIFRVLYIIYMAIVGFVVWSVFWFSG